MSEIKKVVLAYSGGLDKMCIRDRLEQPTVHEGVVARAMEKKGIISDRCELNRQIKADNALLRELRGQVKKLAQAVKNTSPALAEAMENLRKNLLLFCYQLGYLLSLIHIYFGSNKMGTEKYMNYPIHTRV